MNQMNSELNELNVDELYSIASKLKVSKDAMESYEGLLKKNPSHSTRERYSEMLNEYNKALNDYKYFVEHFVIFDEKKEEN